MKQNVTYLLNNEYTGELRGALSVQRYWSTRKCYVMLTLERSK